MVTIVVVARLHWYHLVLFRTKFILAYAKIGVQGGGEYGIRTLYNNSILVSITFFCI